MVTRTIGSFNYFRDLNEPRWASMNNGEPWLTPLRTKHPFYYFPGSTWQAWLWRKRHPGPSSWVKRTWMSGSPQETILCDGGERLWIVNGPFQTVGYVLFGQKKKKEVKIKKGKHKTLMFSSSTKDHRQRKLCGRNPIWESNLIFPRARWFSTP